ncbi:MAG: SDR family oxidoreductase [Acidobacteriota bacterium]
MSALRGKAALVTGASSGIGEALALELARRGARVALAARRADRLEQLAGEIRARGGEALALAADVTRDGDLERAVASTVERFGRLDVAVANAGFGVAARLEKLTLDDYRRQLETNVFGVLRTVYAALPELKKTRGTLAVMGSVAGHVAGAGTSAYCMSKFAVRGLASSLRAELARDGVAVVLLSPGFVDSDIRRTDNAGVVHADAPDPMPRWLRMPADVAARAMARAIAARRREAVITGHGKVAVFLQRFSPGLVSWLSTKAMRGRPEPKRVHRCQV